MKVSSLLLLCSALVGSIAAENVELNEDVHVRSHHRYRLALANEANDILTSTICRNPKAATTLGIRCHTAPTPAPGAGETPAPAPTPVLSDSITYDMHALAIGDWGVDIGLGTCCNKYRKTGTDTEAYYRDRQAQPNVAYLLSLSAQRLKPQVIIGHGDSFYWNGLGSADVQYRFQNTFEEAYKYESLKNVKWVNVMGNHDYGGSMYICGRWDNQFYECPSTEELLKQLEEKFTRQSNYKSPYNDRWKMPGQYYVETLRDEGSGVSVDIFNIDTNAATVHGGEQICCQCYGYMLSDNGKINCNTVHRGHKYCAGGNNDMFDKCLAKLREWQNDSMTQLLRDAKKSKATWKVVNSHYSPHFHMEPNMMKDWFQVLEETGVQLFMNGHAHAESHEHAAFNTHFVTNGAGGGIQSESIGQPPPYVTNVEQVWSGADAPYGFFELSFSKDQMRLQFVTFDSRWSFKKRLGDTTRGDQRVDHCWLIPKDGSRGRACVM